MSIVTKIEKDNKVLADIDKIKNVVLPTLTDLYGTAPWITNPKEDQKPEEIIRQWAKALGNYSSITLKNAIFKVFKFKKSGTFPSLSHILAELVDCEKDDYFFEEVKKEASPGGVDIASYLMEYHNKQGKLRHHRGMYQEAVKRTVNQKLAEKIGYSEFNKIRFNIDMKYKLAKINNLYADFEETLKEVCREWCGKDYLFDEVKNKDMPVNYDEIKKQSETLASSFKVNQNDDDIFSLAG